MESDGLRLDSLSAAGCEMETFAVGAKASDDGIRHRSLHGRRPLQVFPPCHERPSPNHEFVQVHHHLCHVRGPFRVRQIRLHDHSLSFYAPEAHHYHAREFRRGVGDHLGVCVPLSGRDRQSLVSDEVPPFLRQETAQGYHQSILDRIGGAPTVTA